MVLFSSKIFFCWSLLQVYVLSNKEHKNKSSFTVFITDTFLEKLHIPFLLYYSAY